MTYQLHPLTDSQGRPALTQDQLRTHIDQLVHVQRPRLQRLWGYYRNPMVPRAAEIDEQGSQRPYRQAQEWGLPPRITGARSLPNLLPSAALQATRKEVVIENDIGWRIDTQVDYLFGKNLVLTSTAPDPQRRRQIGQLLRLILGHNGGILFLQQLALLGAVYGFVDVLVKLQKPDEQIVDPEMASLEGREDAANEQSASIGVHPDAEPAPSPAPDAPATDVPAPSPDASALNDSSDPGASIPSPDDALARIARMIRLEIVEPARALPFLSPDDWRTTTAYAQCWETPRQAPAARDLAPQKPTLWSRVFRCTQRASEVLFGANEGQTRILEIITRDRWQRYEDDQLVAEGANSLGQIPLVHIQNVPIPMEYSGASDVEPLIPLQDELNTRLSDRANRITLQSFRMYLGKCIENFQDMPVAPGRLWTTDEPEADVIEFGGDANCPSEEAHISDIREALDKVSGVSPIAAGAIKNRIGRLTSAAALRVTLMSLLAKTERKRTTYGAGLERLCALALTWLDVAGVFPTAPHERGIELSWPSPLPENDSEKLQEAEIKLRLGIAPETVRRELGY